jgi:hypothetical protein
MKKTDPKVLTEFNKEAIFSMKPVSDRAGQTSLEDTYSSPILPLDRVSSPKEFTSNEPHSSEETMTPSSKAISVSMSSLLQPFKIILSIFIAWLLLMFSFGLSAGEITTTVDEQSNETLEPAKAESEETAVVEELDIESVTMSIALEEGGTIDLKPPPPDMTIETWKGKDVLLIVEKVNKKGKAKDAVEPIDIQVTRRGKDVHIETMCGEGWEKNGMDVSFRLVIPENRQIMPGMPRHKTTLSDLTTKVWKALNKEAIIRLLL